MGTSPRHRACRWDDVGARRLLVGQVFLVVLLARLVSLYRPLGWRTGLEERLIEERLREERLGEDAAGTGAEAES